MCIYSVLAKALGQVRVRERERESKREQWRESSSLCLPFPSGACGQSECEKAVVSVSFLSRLGSLVLLMMQASHLTKGGHCF